MLGVPSAVYAFVENVSMADVPDWTKRVVGILLPVVVVLAVLAWVLANHKGKPAHRSSPPALKK
jgi:hypothetical protein